MNRPFLIACFALMLSACSREPSLVGTWSSFRNGAMTTWHFHPDGKLETEVTYEGVILHTTGKYSLSGGMLSVNNETAEGVGPEPNLSNYKSKILEPSQLNAHFRSPSQLAVEIPGSTDEFLINKVRPQP